MMSRKAFTLTSTTVALFSSLTFAQSGTSHSLKAEDFCPIFQEGGEMNGVGIDCQTHDFTAIAHEARHFGHDLSAWQIIQALIELSPDNNMDFIHLCAATNETLRNEISLRLSKLLLTPPSSDFLMALGLCSPDNDVKNRIIGYFSKNRELTELALLAIDSKDTKISEKAFHAFKTLYERLKGKGHLSHYMDSLISGLGLLNTCSNNKAYNDWALSTLQELTKGLHKTSV